MTKKKTYKTKILLTEFVTHDVKRFILEKPEGYKFAPGESAEVSIAKKDWKDEKRPFTFTSLPDYLVLELMIKRYPGHEGVTNELHRLKPGEKLLIGDPFGKITFQDKGVFIAGGAGITPFIAILRDLKRRHKIGGNTVIFSNKEQKDIILEKEFEEMFKDKGKLILTLTRKEKRGYEYGRVDRNFLEKQVKDFSQSFYICGPPKMVASLRNSLKELGAEAEEIIF